MTGRQDDPPGNWLALLDVIKERLGVDRAAQMEDLLGLSDRRGRKVRRWFVGEIPRGAPVLDLLSRADLLDQEALDAWLGRGAHAKRRHAEIAELRARRLAGRARTPES